MKKIRALGIDSVIDKFVISISCFQNLLENKYVPTR